MKGLFCASAASRERLTNMDKKGTKSIKQAAKGSLEWRLSTPITSKLESKVNDTNNLACMYNNVKRPRKNVVQGQENNDK